MCLNELVELMTSIGSWGASGRINAYLLERNDFPEAALFLAGRFLARIG